MLVTLVGFGAGGTVCKDDMNPFTRCPPLSQLQECTANETFTARPPQCPSSFSYDMVGSLARLPHGLAHCPEKVADSVPDQGTHRRQLIFLSHINVSLSPPVLSL